MVALLSDKKEFILAAVKEMYTEVAQHPERTFHFPTGRSACLFVGYPGDQLDAVPATAVESFAGVGYPFRSAAIRKNDVVLDIGSGSGTDALIASGLVGSSGKVYGLDMTAAMLEKLRANIAKTGARNVEVLEGNAEAIPLPSATVDVVTSNGVLNLVPDKPKAFAEIFRVLKPGGRVQIADIVVGRPISEECRSNPQLWAECVVGASVEDQYLGMLANAGLDDTTVLRRFDYFSGSSSESTRRVAASFAAHTIEFSMSKA
ncbi:MAG: methyltransferase domain-containing protein [Hyphomicrobiaceae bacterium]|nr:MAG: methyltransferase domain-containing protein [Hyphomicrobiaceae bacterium]